MKKLRLKKWVKVTLLVIMFIGLINLLNLQRERAIDECLSKGNTFSYCQVETR